MPSNQISNKTNHQKSNVISDKNSKSKNSESY